MAQTLYVWLVSAALLGGTASIIYTIPKVKDHWKGTYWLGLGMSLLWDAVFVTDILRRMGVRLPNDLVLYLLETGIVLLALLLSLVPYIHRKEKRLGL